MLDGCSMQNADQLMVVSSHEPGSTAASCILCTNGPVGTVGPKLPRFAGLTHMAFQDYCQYPVLGLYFSSFLNQSGPLRVR